MNKLLSAILAGVFAASLSVGAFAADTHTSAVPEAAKEKPAAPTKKDKHHDKKVEKKAETTAPVAK